MSDKRIRTDAVNSLLAAFADLTDPDDIYALLQDLCTVREIQDMSQRLAVARLLSTGMHYAAIQMKTGASATTISRVSKCLNYGADGYRNVLELSDRDAQSARDGHADDDPTMGLNP
jgi:TrpR-related protein YerC/YecD